MTAELRAIVPLAHHERILVCTRCDTPILVCGWVDDLGPDTYLGVACGCRLTPASPDLHLVMNRAQQAQKGAAA